MTREEMLRAFLLERGHTPGSNVTEDQMWGLILTYGWQDAFEQYQAGQGGGGSGGGPGWRDDFPNYNPESASFEEYERAREAWQRHDDAYYAGERSDPPGRPPQRPPGYLEWRESGLPEDEWRRQREREREQRQERRRRNEFRENTRALLPWLPDELVNVYADEWAESGDRDLALARMRQHEAYDRHFAGIKRADGSIRFAGGEREYISTMNAYRTLMSDFGLNPAVFQGRFVGLMEGEVSPNELAERLGSAYEGIVTNIPQVRRFYANEYGINMSDQAILASVIDPDIGDAILNRRISVAAVGGEGLARGFDVGLNMAEELSDAGLDQQSSREFFSRAEAQIPLFERLALRHRDPDDTFDLGEFADLSVFQDPEQARRVDRLLAAESSLFTEQLGTFATNDSLALTGLRTL